MVFNNLLNKNQIFNGSIYCFIDVKYQTVSTGSLNSNITQSVFLTKSLSYLKRKELDGNLLVKYVNNYYYAKNIEKNANKEFKRNDILSHKSLINFLNVRQETFFHCLNRILKHTLLLFDVLWSWLKVQKWRLNIFSKYPSHLTKSSILFAADGFVFIGNLKKLDSYIICHFFGAVLNLWQPSGENRPSTCSMIKKKNCPNISIEDRLKSSGVFKNSDEEAVLANGLNGRHVNDKIQEIVDQYTEGRVCHYHQPSQPCRGKDCDDKIDGPLHPKYSCLFARRKTIVDWMQDAPNSCKIIAEAGYFFCQQSKRFICHFCGVPVLVFRSVENILIDHAILSPHCGFIQRMMGQRFIHVVQESFRADIPARDVLNHLPELDHLLSMTVTKKEKNISESIQALTDEHRKATRCSICNKDRSVAVHLPCGTGCCADCMISRSPCCCGLPIKDHQEKVYYVDL